MLVPWVWNFLELPNLSQTAITVAAVMAVQATTEDEVANRQRVVTRATHRILGCLIGGLAGLAVLSLSLESFVPWLIMLCAGIWIGAHVQSSTRGIGYVGTQGAVVFMMTLVQDFGATDQHRRRRRTFCRHHRRAADRARGVSVDSIRCSRLRARS